jgi:hypothetical protein
MPDTNNNNNSNNYSSSISSCKESPATVKISVKNQKKSFNPKQIPMGKNCIIN